MTEKTVAGADDPLSTTPMPRYNAMLAILRNTLYMLVHHHFPDNDHRTEFFGRYGGIFERGSHEYTLDDFYSIQLDKMDRFVCLKKTDIVIAEDEESSSDDGDDEDSDDGTEEDGDDDESENEEDADDKVMSGTALTSPSKGNKETPTEAEHGSEEGAGAPEDPQLTKVATSEVCRLGILFDGSINVCVQDFLSEAMGTLTTRSVEDVQSTPLPGETLAVFYARTRKHLHPN